MISSTKAPDLVAWSREFAEILPAACARRLKDRPVLVLHGADDDIVPARRRKSDSATLSENRPSCGYWQARATGSTRTRVRSLCSWAGSSVRGPDLDLLRGLDLLQG